MKPIHTLTWAVSAPILLFAGATHAVSISDLTDPSCNGSFFFDSDNNKIACQTTSAPPPSDPPPSDPPPSDPPPSDPPPSDPPTSCPATPAGTTIIAAGGKDAYSKMNFNQAFDAPGNRIDSRSEAGEIKAWEFDNNNYLSGKITGTAGNYGANYKNWSVSACPGDFSASLPAACLRIRRTGLTMYYHATNTQLSDGTPSCVIPAGKKMYLNVRATDPAQAAGYVSSNNPSAALP